MRSPHIHSARANHGSRRSAGPRDAGSRNARSRQAAFTLIEIMAVVLIMGFLAGVVGVAVMDRIDQARVTTTRTQIKNLEAALTFFQMDNGFYPTTDQGLDALVRKPTGGREPRNYRAGGYLSKQEMPRDAWDNPFQYQSPGQYNRDYDIWSLGADAAPGGADTDADIGNWPEDAVEG